MEKLMYIKAPDQGFSSLPCGPRLRVAAAAFLALAACQREEVTHVQVPKGSDRLGSGIVPPPNRAPGGERPGGRPMPEGGMPGTGMPGAELPEPPKPAAGGLKWTLPKGWTEALTEGMRYATLKPPAEGKVEVSVVVLPGPAGGELANVNRWRTQIGLSGIDEAALPTVRKAMESKAGPLSLYDFTSDGTVKTRMVVGLLAASDGNSWFLKLTGDAEPVAVVRGDFIQLLESLRFD
jgi:hypothetical protein